MTTIYPLNPIFMHYKHGSQVLVSQAIKDVNIFSNFESQSFDNKTRIWNLANKLTEI